MARAALPAGGLASASRELLFRYGFLAVFLALIAIFALAAPSFLSLGNALALLHAAAPMMVVAGGLALVVFTGKLDISVGSVAYLSGAVAVLVMTRTELPPVLGVLAALATGAALGALNGLIVVGLKVNPLITTLGTMIALRGVAYQITGARVIGLPEGVRRLGNLALGPVFADILAAFLVLLCLHLLYRRTVFGRHLAAIGNGEEVAARLGVRVPRTVFLAFLLSGLLASLGGLMSAVQVGAVTPMLGEGMEFTAVAVIVIGGISLFGGRGSILPSLLLGVVMLEMIRNGLNLLGANPFSYRFVNGGIIFLAMYADSLKARLRRRA